MSSTFTSFELSDLRFPTSRDLAGSDAMNPDPNYSAAYLLLRTSAGDEGHGFVFTRLVRYVDEDLADLRVLDCCVSRGRILELEMVQRKASLPTDADGAV
jgi:hypothetical protein